MNTNRTEHLKQVKEYLQACKNVFALMEAPNENIFKFLQMQDCLKGCTISAKRNVRQWYKSESNRTTRVMLWAVNMMTTQNVFLLSVMADGKTDIETFLHYSQKASTNTEKALSKLNNIQNTWNV